MISEPFQAKQGVRQGGVLSTILYTVYINDLLEQLTEEGAGTYIGEVFAGAPTCADDVLMMAPEDPEAQVMCDTADSYSASNLYGLQPTKCSHTSLRPSEAQLLLNQRPIPQKTIISH